MLISLYVSLMLLSIIILVIGYWAQILPLQILGFMFLFVINVPLINSTGIEYKVGNNITETSPTNTYTTDIYNSFSIRTIAMFISIMGLFGAGIMAYMDWYERRDNRINGDDD